MKLRAGQPTVAEIVAHPTYPDTIFQLTPTKSGKLAVAAKRGGPFNIDWEVHGTGDIKVIVCIYSLITFVAQESAIWTRRMLSRDICTYLKALDVLRVAVDSFRDVIWNVLHIV